MADDLGQSFLEGIFKTRELQQQARQQQAEMQFRQAQLQSENQRAQASLAELQDYHQNLVKDTQANTAAQVAEHQLNAQRNGAVVAQPMAQAAPLVGTPQPDTPQGLPLGNMPNQLQRAGLQLPPEGAVNLGGMLLRQQTPQELQSQAQTMQDAERAHKDAQASANLKQMLAAGVIDQGQYQKMSALYGASSALGRPLNEAEASVIAPKPTALKEGDESIGDQSMADAVNKLTLQRLQVLNPKMQALPPEMVVSPKTTRNQLATIDKIMTGTESAKSTVAQQAQSNALRQAMVDVANGRLDVSRNKQAVTIYQPAVDSAERFNIMTENYEKAVKDHDQQAMLSLLSNHIGMTLGAQKGARITKDIIHEAEVSRPFLQGMGAKFDKDGILSGVTLTVPQMQQMVGLGQSRLMEDTNKAKNVAGFAGLDTDGPERTPNAATVNFYMSKTHGDKAAAKKLATADGWTVK